MMRIPTASEGGETPKNGVASMVDIAFLLLIFFLVATTIVPAEQDLAMPLARPGAGLESPSLPIWIEVADDQSVWWGEGVAAIEVVKPEDGRQLRDFEEMIAGALQADSATSTRVILKVGGDVTQQRFTDVLNVLSGHGIEQVGLVE